MNTEYIEFQTTLATTGSLYIATVGAAISNGEVIGIEVAPDYGLTRRQEERLADEAIKHWQAAQ